ncbi:MAG: hypothetical protein HDR19_09530 [Lachnospiraceae bacterium]|nr:hypothetical protein [Lachnospiraceae bacterium]
MKESMEEMINFIVESMKSLNRQAFSVYKPIVDEICSGRVVRKGDYYKGERDDKREQALSRREMILMIYCNHSEGG